MDHSQARLCCIRGREKKLLHCMRHIRSARGGGGKLRVPSVRIHIPIRSADCGPGSAVSDRNNDHIGSEGGGSAR